MNANSNQSARSEELISSQALIKRDADSVAGTIYRYTDIAFQRGDGVYLYDFEGHRYLDFVSGIATMNVILLNFPTSQVMFLPPGGRIQGH